MKKIMYDNFVNILKSELVPALGCTEPIALAYAGAKARDVLGQMPERVVVHCSGNIIKNVKGVTVPNSDGMKGIAVAVILGIVGGDAENELEVLEKITKDDIAKTKELVNKKFCDTLLQEDVENLYITAKVFAKEHSAEVTIINRHTYITKIVKDNVVLFNKDAEINEIKDTGIKLDKSQLNIKRILEFAENLDVEDVRDIIERQIEMNTAISKEGLKVKYGTQIGRTLLSEYGDGIVTRAKAKVAAGSDARMSGCSMPVVINSGSGNQGMTVSLPVIEYANELNVSREILIRALVISNLIAIHQKKYIGSLSAFCGVVSAACGAGAAITYLYGGGYDKICMTIINTIGNVGGIVCDGAKSSCAAKIASSVDAAIMAHHLSMHGHVFQPGEGIVMTDIEDTIKSMGYIGRIGMKDTDKQILNLMINKIKI